MPHLTGCPETTPRVTPTLHLQILLLDEATSALDSGCEKAVQAALETLAPGRTCVAVAHRLSTVVQADTIHVLRNGAVVESGTHRHLLERGGVYASLAAKQALCFDGEEGAEEGEGGIAAGGGGKSGRRMRDSVLRRGSVRLSIIPQASCQTALRRCCIAVWSVGGQLPAHPGIGQLPADTPYTVCKLYPYLICRP